MQCNLKCNFIICITFTLVDSKIILSVLYHILFFYGGGGGVYIADLAKYIYKKSPLSKKERMQTNKFSGLGRGNLSDFIIIS